jgi:hypothetical protein
MIHIDEIYLKVVTKKSERFSLKTINNLKDFGQNKILIKDK